MNSKVRETEEKEVNMNKCIIRRGDKYPEKQMSRALKHNLSGAGR